MKNSKFDYFEIYYQYFLIDQTVFCIIFKSIQFKRKIFLKIKLSFQHFDLDNDMTDRIINRVCFALSSFGSKISHVQIRFSDVNGPKGGQDNHCLLSVKLISSGKIVTNGKGVDLLSTLHFYLEQTKRAIIRELERKRFVPIRMKLRCQKRKNLHPMKNRNIHLGINGLKELLTTMNGAA